MVSRRLRSALKDATERYGSSYVHIARVLVEHGYTYVGFEEPDDEFVDHYFIKGDDIITVANHKYLPFLQILDRSGKTIAKGDM